MDLRDLKAFVAIAEEGSYHGAAKRLHTSQPPLSRRIRALEETLGVQLFRRGRHGAVLSEEGETLFARARDILQRVGEAEQETRATHGGLSGRLVVGYTDDFQYSALTKALSGFVAQFPRIAIDMRQADSAILAREVEEGHLNIALISTPLPSNLSDVGITVLDRTPLYALVPADHPVASMASIPLTMLKDERFVFGALIPTSGYYIQVMGCFQRADFTPEIIPEIKPSEMIANMVAAGVGVSLVIRDSLSPGRTDVTLVALDDGATIERALIWRRPAPSALGARVSEAIMHAFGQKMQ